MKFSISNIAWKKEENETVIDVLFKNNIRNIDVAPLLVVDSLIDYKDESINVYKNFWGKKKINLLGMQSIFYESKEKNIFDNNQEYFLDYFNKVAKFSKKANIEKIVFGCPRQRSFGEKTSKKEVYDFFKKIVNICENYELFLCLEPNAKEYNCNFLNTTKETIDFVKLMNSNYAKINFDTGTVLMNKKNPTEIIKHAYSFIGHIHISSPMLKPVHENSMDHLSFSNYLKQQNYDKGISIEMLTEKYKVNTVDAIEKAINVFKKFYL